MKSATTRATDAHIKPRGLTALCAALLAVCLAGPAAAQSGMVRVTGVASNDVLNVRSGPSTGYDIIGALANGDRVESLGCQNDGGSHWCRIRMLDEMGGEGWVNGRYLKAAHRGNSGAAIASEPGGTATSAVRFAPGSTGTEIRGELAPGASHNFVLNARSGQDLRVRVNGRGLSYQIFNPDRTFLLDQVPDSQHYRGELWQSGDHVIEVINRGNRARSFDIVIGVN